MICNFVWKAIRTKTKYGMHALWETTGVMLYIAKKT